MPFGTIQVLSDLRDILAIKYPDTKFTLNDAEKYINRGVIRKGDNVDNMPYKDKIISSYCNKIMMELNQNFSVYKNALIYVTGGGVSLFNELLMQLLRYEILPDTIFNNANGFKMVGESIWL